MEKSFKNHGFGDTVFPSTNTLVYAHTSSRMLPTCDISLGSLTIAMSEAGDFVK